MKKASKLFSEKERQAVAEAITAAESQTSGEIVPVVATASGRYDRAGDLFGVVTALIALAGVWIGFQDIRLVETEWGQQLSPTLGLLPVLAIVLAGFVLGTCLATLVPELRQPFITRKELEEEVARSTAEIFQRLRLRRTAGATGILIYVSLYERRVRVLGDDAIAARLSDSDWQGVCDLVVQGLRKGQAADGLIRAIAACGELLATHFPIQPDDVNELSNELHLID